jgi:transcriptional regulator with XRE-family HTH domain
MTASNNLLLESLSLKMRLWRARKRVSQAQLAKQSGLCQATIAQIECNRKSPSLESLSAIAFTMETSVAQLLTLDNTK